MMWNLVWLVGLWLLPFVKSQSTLCPVSGHTPPQHQEKHNFILDKFTRGMFPYAINKCTATDILSNSKWTMYTCVKDNNDWKVVKREYTDSTCTGAGTVVATIGRNYTNGSLPNFECDGVNSYAEILIGLSDTCSSNVKVYAGLHGCTPASGQLSFEVYCNSSVGFVEFFHTNVDQLQSTTGEPMPSTSQPILTTNEPILSTIEPILTTILTKLSELTESTELPDLELSTTNLNLSFNSTDLLSSTDLLASTDLLESTNLLETTELLESTNLLETSNLLETTNLFSTYLETTGAAKLSCDSDKYCEVWILPTGKCTNGDISIFRNLGSKIYGQLLSCHTNLTQGTEPPKKSGSRFQLAITAIFTLLFVIARL